MAAEKSRVNTTSRPTASMVESRLGTEVSLYIATTGRISRMKMMKVMISPTSFSTLSGE